MRGRRTEAGAGSHEPETLHPSLWAPGYFDGCPKSFRSNRERPSRIREGLRDMTGNVQLYLPAGGLAPVRMGGPLVRFAARVKAATRPKFRPGRLGTHP